MHQAASRQPSDKDACIPNSIDNTSTALGEELRTKQLALTESRHQGLPGNV
jgi:hypothetical protein